MQNDGRNTNFQIKIIYYSKIKLNKLLISMIPPVTSPSFIPFPPPACLWFLFLPFVSVRIAFFYSLSATKPSAFTHSAPHTLTLYVSLFFHLVVYRDDNITERTEQKGVLPFMEGQFNFTESLYSNHPVQFYEYWLNELTHEDIHHFCRKLIQQKGWFSR